MQITLHSKQKHKHLFTTCQQDTEIELCAAKPLVHAPAKLAAKQQNLGIPLWPRVRDHELHNPGGVTADQRSHVSRNRYKSMHTSAQALANAPPL